MTSIDANLLSVMAGRQLPFFSLLIPVWMVVPMSGWRGLKQFGRRCWLAAAVLPRCNLWSRNIYGPMLVDVAGGLVSLVVMGFF